QKLDKTGFNKRARSDLHNCRDVRRGGLRLLRFTSKNTRLVPTRRGVREGPPVHQRLEDDLGSELQGAGVVGTCEFSNISAADPRVDAPCVYVSAELSMVPEVVGLKTQFTVKPLGEGNVLEQRHVPVVTSGTAQRVLPHIAEDRCR